MKPSQCIDYLYRTFVEKVLKNLANDEKLSKPTLREECDFAVIHYAGRVPYQVSDWLVKNKDPLNDNVTSLLSKSNQPFIATLWSDIFSGALASANRTRKGAFRTVGFIYKVYAISLLFCVCGFIIFYLLYSQLLYCLLFFLFDSCSKHS